MLRRGFFWADEIDISNEVIERMPGRKDAQAADSEKNKPVFGILSALNGQSLIAIY
jgi:hypothetical protein